MKASRSALAVSRLTPTALTTRSTVTLHTNPKATKRQPVLYDRRRRRRVQASAAAVRWCGACAAVAIQVCDGTGERCAAAWRLWSQTDRSADARRAAGTSCWYMPTPSASGSILTSSASGSCSLQTRRRLEFGISTAF